jgi:hypothetical protein
MERAWWRINAKAGLRNECWPNSGTDLDTYGLIEGGTTEVVPFPQHMLTGLAGVLFVQGDPLHGD